jgi:hypothetical protein
MKATIKNNRFIGLGTTLIAAGMLGAMTSLYSTDSINHISIFFLIIQFTGAWFIVRERLKRKEFGELKAPLIGMFVMISMVIAYMLLQNTLLAYK